MKVTIDTNIEGVGYIIEGLNDLLEYYDECKRIAKDKISKDQIEIKINSIINVRDKFNK
jgi:hypothetical protein